VIFWAGGVVQVVEHLLANMKPLVQTLVLPKKTNKKQNSDILTPVAAF
jgi:hypothetical protein